MSCKRKHRSEKHNFLTGSGDGAELSGEFYADSSGIRSPHKKRRVKEQQRFHQSIDEDSSGICLDEVQMFGSDNSSMFRTNSAEKQQVTSTADEQLSSNFEELLFGVISENECSQVFSQKCSTSGVPECTSEQLQVDTCLNDTSSDSNYSDTSPVSDKIATDSHFSMERNNAHLHRTNGSLSNGTLNSCNNTIAADSEIYTANDYSVARKAGLSHSGNKQDKNVKPEKGCRDYANLLNKSEYCEKKPKQKRCHAFASLIQTDTFSDSSGQYGLLRKAYRMVNRHGTVCEKMSTHTKAESDSDVLQPSKKHKQQGRSKKVTKDRSDFGGLYLTSEHMSLSVVDNVCTSADNHIETGFVDNERRVVDSLETVVAVDHLDPSLQNSEVEAGNEDHSVTLPTSCSKQNVLKSHVTLTEDYTESRDLLLHPHKKKKKKKHCVHDRLSEKQQKREKITEVENQDAIKNNDCKKASNSELTPCKRNSHKTITGESMSSSVCSESNSVTAPSPQVSGNVNMQNTDYRNDSGQTQDLFPASLACSVKKSQDLLLEENVLEEHGADLCENGLKEVGFEQLLLTMVVGDDESSIVSHSDNSKSCSEHLVTNSRELGHELSESTSDDDSDDMAVAQQRTSVNSPHDTLAQTGSARYEFSSCKFKSKDNKLMTLVKCNSEVKKSRAHSTHRSDRSPSLLGGTLLQRFDDDMHSPVSPEEVSDIDRSTPGMSDAILTPDKSVFSCYLLTFFMEFVELYNL